MGADHEAVYQLEVVAPGETRLWPRVTLRGSSSFQELHRVLEEALQQAPSQRYQFVVGDELISELDRQVAWFFKMGVDSRRARLDRYLSSAGDEFSYMHDYSGFGEHAVRVASVSSADAA